MRFCFIIQYGGCRDSSSWRVFFIAVNSVLPPFYDEFSSWMIKKTPQPFHKFTVKLS